MHRGGAREVFARGEGDADDDIAVSEGAEGR